MMGSKYYHNWTCADINFLRENYGILTVEQLAESVGVKSLWKVRGILSRYHIKKAADIPNGWSKEQYDIFMAEYKTCKNIRYLSHKIGKTKGAIYALAYLKGMNRRSKRKIAA